MPTIRLYGRSNVPAVPTTLPVHSSWVSGPTLRGNMGTGKETGNSTGATPGGVRCAHQYWTGADVLAPYVGKTLAGSSRAVWGGRRSTLIPASVGRIVVRVVAADDVTPRAVLVVLNATESYATASSSPPRKHGPAALTPYTVQAGDRIVVEVGADVATGSSSTSFQGGASPGTPDYDWDSLADSRAPWVDLYLDEPPQEPTALVVTDVAATTATLSWTAPAAGGEPTGYEYRLNDGAAVPVGLVTTATLEPLSPLTGYTVQVRTVAGAAVSPWSAPAAFATLPLLLPPYRAVVRLGDRTWDVDAGDPPAYGPLLPLSFGWAVPEDALGFPAQPDPDLCALELLTVDSADMAGVDIGTTMRVSIYVNATAERPLATFRGRVADLEATPSDHAPTALAWRLLGVGYTADPGGTTVGAAEWPQESGDARAARIMAEAGYPGWSADPIGTTWEARNPDPVPARAELEAVVAQSVTAEGNPWGPSRRVLFHPNTDAEGNLDPDAPFSGTAVIRRTDALDTITAGLVNRRTSWRRTKLLDATWVKIDHPGGPTVYGDPRGSAYPPVSVSVVDPRELADLVLDTTPGFRWLTGDALRLEAHAADTATLDTVARWFYRDPASEPFPWAGRAVVVDNITQTPDGSTRYAGLLRAATVVLEPSPVGGRLVVLFWLRPDIPPESTVTMRWVDEPAGATWADELATDPTGSWYDYYTRPRP